MEFNAQIASLGAKFAEISAGKGCYEISGTNCRAIRYIELNHGVKVPTEKSITSAWPISQLVIMSTPFMWVLAGELPP